MAQLIKLQDYISRYETDLSRYPSQYIRLKKQQWEKIKVAWEMGELDVHKQPIVEEVPEKRGVFNKIKQIFNRDEDDFLNREYEEALLRGMNEEELDVSFSFNANTELELKQQFLDHLLKFQIKWASSTIAEKSFVDSRYYEDLRLKHFLQSFPDHTLLLYEPVFLLKKAPVEFELLLLTPTDIWCLAFLEEEEDAVYIGSNDHFWSMKIGDRETKVLSPMMSANRMGKIVKQLFTLAGVDLPIHKVIVSRTGFIDYPDVPSDLQFLDKRSYEEWFQKIRHAHSPVKRMQMQAAKVLLDYCQTTSFRRPEWEHDRL